MGLTICASFCLFSFFSRDECSTNLNINDESIDGVLGTWTRGSRMVGTDKSTELWRHPSLLVFLSFPSFLSVYFCPVVDVLSFFGGNLNFPKIKNGKKFVLMSKPALKCENNASLKQIYTLKQFIA